MAWREREPSMTDDQWVQAYVDLSARLAEKYGDADLITATNPPACDQSLRALFACIESGTAHRSMAWAWKSPSALVFLAFTPGRPGTSIAVEYSSETWMQQRDDNL